MAPDSDDLLAQQLRQLRREYLRESATRLDELRMLRLRAAKEGAAALPDIRQAFHRLAGSGGSYGFPDVSARSREGEHLAAGLMSAGTVPSPDDLASLDRAIDGVAEAFGAATRSMDGGM